MRITLLLFHSFVHKLTHLEIVVIIMEKCLQLLSFCLCYSICHLRSCVLFTFIWQSLLLFFFFVSSSSKLCLVFTNFQICSELINDLVCQLGFKKIGCHCLCQESASRNSTFSSCFLSWTHLTLPKIAVVLIAVILFLQQSKHFSWSCYLRF